MAIDAGAAAPPVFRAESPGARTCAVVAPPFHVVNPIAPAALASPEASSAKATAPNPINLPNAVLPISFRPSLEVDHLEMDRPLEIDGDVARSIAAQSCITSRAGRAVVCRTPRKVAGTERLISRPHTLAHRVRQLAADRNRPT
ncbi:MAG: hypothetical protein IPK00_11415 [Deltaproteobacteria bacterium]|nr:hypothetical protein [Deltaproteobacteria bacterium]